MTTKKYAIPEHVAKMAKEYGKNVSTGIQEMYRIIGKKRKGDLR
jgi:hypothetical protein